MRALNAPRAPLAGSVRGYLPEVRPAAHSTRKRALKDPICPTDRVLTWANSGVICLDRQEDAVT